MPYIANLFATSFPCTLTCAGTCSHSTPLPGVAISWSSNSLTLGGGGGLFGHVPSGFERQSLCKSND